MKFLSTTFFLLFAALSFRQTVGKIVYEEKVDMYRHIPEDRQDIRNRVPQYHSAKWDFIFNDDESVYMRHKAEEAEYTSTQGNTQMTMRFGRDQRVVYKNVVENKMIDSRTIMDKQFLITGQPTVRKWKIGKNSKDIKGYNCLEASFQQDSVTNIKAWFTPQIAQFNGPADYQGLPGMILELDFNDGERVLTASEIKFEGADTSLIVAPTKGKEVTPEEFEAIRQEKMKEMGMQGGPGGPGGPPMQMTIIRN